MTEKYKFTVFTPTYNREKKLHVVYESLKQQTFKNFEWLVVDDGSSDNTKQLVEKWKKESSFEIRYVYQENSGKHRAINKGVTLANGEFFLIADSDDFFVPKALEIFNTNWEDLKLKDDFIGVTALCMDLDSNIIGDKFPKDVFDSNSLDVCYKYNIKGEKWGFQRTDILKKYPFPQFKNEKFLTESVVWNEIALNYKTRFINIPIRVYEIFEDSLTFDPVSLRKNNIQGTLYYYDKLISYDIPFFSKILLTVNYVRFMLHSKKIAMGFRRSNNKLFVITSFPLGIIAYLKDKLL